VIKFQEIIKEEIDRFDSEFKNTLSTKALLLHKITKHISKNSGKKIRPICTIIASGLVNSVTEKTYRSAILIELIHTATLVHDDIVDDAQIRRGQFATNTIWKNKIAVLTGDYFLAKGLELSVLKKDYDTLGLISNVVQKMVEGELVQIEKTKKLNLTELEYFKIIELKTGVLFECAFELGGVAADANTEDLHKLRSLGLILGILFQIKDDILDYTNISFSGKQPLNDIKEGKINFPLLSSLKKMNIIERSRVFRILRKKTNTQSEYIYIKELVVKYKGIEEAELIIQQKYNDALNIISSFKDGKYKKSISSLVRFLIDRKK
tara:strand:+ start:5273 stop:6238 length:966 start_codon:yes stop_codon:yes gene_type:complete